MNDIIREHAKYPKFMKTLESFNCSYEWNDWRCWNKLKCFLNIDGDEIKDIWFSWDNSMYVKAWASMAWELTIWKDIKEVILLKYNDLEYIVWERIWHDTKRKSLWLWLLCIINSINRYKWRRIIYYSDIT